MQKCKIIYKDKEYDLTKYLDDINKKYNKGNQITIKLKSINNITSCDNMFYRCKSLVSLSGLSKWETSKITDMSGMFSGCQSLKSLPDISNWNTSNVDGMDFMFDRCKSLISLPDIYLNGIFIMLMEWFLYFVIVNHYYH